MNRLFDAFLNETDPVYDIAFISDAGVEYWHNTDANSCNNSHSATKFFVATAIGILCDRGLISPDTKITSVLGKELLPDGMPEGWNGVTVKNAMMHKTGIGDHDFCVDDDDAREKLGDDYLSRVLTLPLPYAPDTERVYSDEAYYLLGRVIGAVTGKTADVFIKENILDKLDFHQWAMAKCPKGHPICGGGFYTRADDMAKLGWTYANDGVYNGRRIVSAAWTDLAMKSDFACTAFRDTDIYLKTGAKGQCVAFSKKRKSAAAWHGVCNDNGKRNDRLLLAYSELLDERFGKL